MWRHFVCGLSRQLPGELPVHRWREGRGPWAVRLRRFRIERCAPGLGEARCRRAGRPAGEDAKTLATRLRARQESAPLPDLVGRAVAQVCRSEEVGAPGALGAIRWCQPEVEAGSMESR
ncbi:hypothetical protein GCM10022206_55650 [Streptomyces chiangmaiensis]